MNSAYQLNLDAPPCFVTTSCQDCGRTFEAFRAFESFGPTRCEICIDRIEAEANEKLDDLQRKDLSDRWQSICPAQFMTMSEGGVTDEARLRRDQPLYDAVMRWRFGPRGLLLIGETGRCKTRIAWRLMRRLFDEGRRVRAISAVRFDIEALEYMRTQGFKRWFDSLIEADVLFVDDIGKGRLSDAVESRFFGLIDERTANCRPCIITSNDDGPSLAARMSEHRGPATIRRLRDNCDVIVFKTASTHPI